MEAHTILVVDDEPASLRALRRTLAPSYSVLCAGNGPEALEQLATQSVSVLVTDHRMPGMVGSELVALCRVRSPDTVRIVLTGYADLDAILDAINRGEVFAYLTKPWEPRELLLSVRRGVERLQAHRERVRLLEELETACERAEREVERRGRLLATAAHELGTPVHVLGNALDLLSAIPSVQGSEWLALADRSAAWLRRGLVQLRAAAVLENGGVRLRMEAVDLSEMLSGLVDALRTAAAARALEFEARVASGVQIHGDSRWLRDLWVSLLSNAVRFTRDGGRVEIAAESRAGGAAVVIRDSGIGMAKEHLAVAFEPFSNAGGDLLLHGSGRFDFGARGMGVGLAIARGVVDLHGGTIDLESSPGAGTACRVWLPANPRRCDGIG